MIKKLTWLTLFLIAATTICIRADNPQKNAVKMELTVRQKPAGIDKYYEIIKDTADVIIGKGLGSFLAGINLNIILSSADSQSAAFDVHLTTIGQKIYNSAERFRIEYNLPARLENIPGKGGSVYQLLISPRELIEIDTSCAFETIGDDRFNMSPSANFDIHYIQYSLGDFYWANVKNYLEYDFTRFRSSLNIISPGKIQVFLIPCAAGTVNWDDRFGYAIDPGRGNIFTIFNRNYISLDAILPNLLTLYRAWGYAPPLIVEGLAGYFEFSQYEMKKIKEQNRLIDLKNLVTSASYFSADPIAGEITAASFAKYLVDSYGIGKYKSLYEGADDLNIVRMFNEVYSAPLDSLEKEWLYYVDTVTIPRQLFDFYASRAGVMFRTGKQIEYLTEMTKYDSSSQDSADTWNKLASAYYQSGQYYEAIDGYKLLTRIDRPKPLYKLILGNLYMINGEYDNAYAIFDTVFAADSTIGSARLLQAKIKAIQGDTTGAIRLAEENFRYELSLPGKVEFLLFLGEMYGTRGTHYDSAKAHDNFADALVWANDMIPQAPLDPAPKLKAGQASLGLGRYEEARQFLEVARFTEMRAYYLGRALLYLGKLEDVLGDHDKAIEYYREAISLPIADFDRELCLRHIQEPYK